jgi:hypothetical protein
MAENIPFPPRATEILQALHAKHRDLAEGNDDTRRALMRIIAQQLAFELGSHYGVKSAGVGRPQGPSTIAYESPDGFGGWRVIDGDGSATGVVNGPIPHPPFQSFSGQVFIPVPPTDHLGVRAVPDLPPITVSMPPERPPAPPSASIDPSAILGALARLDATLTALEAHVADLDAREPPTYRGSLFGIAVVLHPDRPNG